MSRRFGITFHDNFGVSIDAHFNDDRKDMFAEAKGFPEKDEENSCLPFVLVKFTNNPKLIQSLPYDEKRPLYAQERFSAFMSIQRAIELRDDMTAAIEKAESTVNLDPELVNR